jgi:hypothetical protein
MCTIKAYCKQLTGRLLLIHQLPANYLTEEWSMRSLASCAQNNTGYIKDFVMSWYFKSTPHHTMSQKSQTPHPSDGDIIYRWSIILICPPQKQWCYIYNYFIYYYLHMYVEYLVTTYLVAAFNDNLIII